MLGVFFLLFIWLYFDPSFYTYANFFNSNTRFSNLLNRYYFMYIRNWRNARTFFTSSIIYFLGNVKTMILGLVIFIISNMQVTFWTENINTEQVIFNMLYRGISISVYYVALANITYTTLPVKYRTYGAGLFQFFRTMGTGVAVAVFIAFLNRFHFYYFEEFRNFLDYGNFRIINQLNMEEFSEKNLLICTLKLTNKLK